MKKVIFLILSVTLSTICTAQDRADILRQIDSLQAILSAMDGNREPDTQNSGWGVYEYKDSFGDPTGMSFVSKLEYGYFSNSATSRSKLSAVIAVDKIQISIMLFEYGTHKVKDEGNYIVLMRSDIGDKTFVGELKADRIVIKRLDKFDTPADFINELKRGGIKKMYIQSKYKDEFRFDLDADGFERLYSENIGN